MGAETISVPSGQVAEAKASMHEAVTGAKYVAWASMRIARSQDWDMRDGQGRNIMVQQPVKEVYSRQVAFVEHTYTPRRQGGVQCSACGRWATTVRARQQLDTQRCLGAQGVQKMMAQERLRQQARQWNVQVDELLLEEPNCEAISLAMLAAKRHRRDWLELLRQQQRQRYFPAAEAAGA